MKIYTKGLFVATVLSTFSLMAAESKIIQVTTFADEYGTNLSKCSLREAIQTAHDNKSYGGCNVGNTLNGQKDYIQLQAGEYLLDKGELEPKSPVILYGELPFDENEKDLLTGSFPKQLPIQTTINANFKSRIFNTSRSHTSLDINNIALINGEVNSETPALANGGTLFIGGSLSLYNSAILNSKARNKGGAIYFAGSDENLSVSIHKTLLKNNLATSGSVWAMDCKHYSSFVTSPLTISQSSIVENGFNIPQRLNSTNMNTSSILDFCGAAAVEISSSTIAKNDAEEENGTIISHIDKLGQELTDRASLTLLSNTIVENTAKSIYLYDAIATNLLSSNIIAYNKGKSCQYTPDDKVADTENVNMISLNNALSDTCYLPSSAKSETAQDFLISDPNNNAEVDSGLLTAYKSVSAYNLYLPLYYPVKNASVENDFVDAGHQTCSGIDQRGFARISVSKLVLDPNSENTCDYGSVELMRLTASDITALKNSPYSELIGYYEDSIADLKAMQDNPANKSSLLQIQSELKDFESLLTNTKKYNKYRAIYIDPFELALPIEESTENGELKLKAFNTENYKVEVIAKGVGTLTEGADNPYNTTQDPNQKCEWIPELKRIMFYRTDANATDITSSEFCEYKITELKSGVATSLSSSGVISAQFVNIAPVAKSDTYILNPDSNLSVTVNPLENDFDDDGVSTTTADGTIRGKYFKNSDGSETPIRFESVNAGLTMSAERTGPCPDTHVRDTCYGGKITFTAKNNLSQFDYDATYNYFDVDGTMSNTATITLKNSAKNTNTSSSGGGSLGLFGVIGLLGLAAYRSRRKYH